MRFALLLIFSLAVYAQSPARTCESLRSIALPNTTVDSATTVNQVCRVDVSVTHPPAGDRVRVFIALPLEKWNGRFQGTGGGGFVGGTPNSLTQAANQGYAVASTDTGHEGGSGSFALDSQGRLNWMLIRDNAYLGIHEMTVTGKAIAEAFYGKAPRYSYFNGCSTGGRQGLSEAQRYPEDYNGILSGAPAINWTKLHIAQAWGPLVMLEAKHYVAPCKFAAATAAAIAACDAADGVTDGVIADPAQCKFAPTALVGKPAAAGCEAFTADDTDIIAKIWEGPRRRDGSFLWYGLPRGADFIALNSRQPMGITLNWWRYFLLQNPNWEWQTTSRAHFEQIWDQSVEQFGPVFATDNADLTPFRDRGGKAIMWHGWADQLIPAHGTIDYYNRVRERAGPKTAEFLRLFLAPGVAHCGGGAGPAPQGQFQALVNWVENGLAPETLRAVKMVEGQPLSRPLCQYPAVARYKGSGSTSDAANFVCAR